MPNVTLPTWRVRAAVQKIKQEKYTRARHSVVNNLVELLSEPFPGAERVLFPSTGRGNTLIKRQRQQHRDTGLLNNV